MAIVKQVNQYDAVGATTLWLPLALHGRFNPGRWKTCVDCGIDEGQYSKRYAEMFEQVIAIDGCIRDHTRETLQDVNNVELVEQCLWSEPGQTRTWYELKWNTFLSGIDADDIQRVRKEWNVRPESVSSYEVITDTVDRIVDAAVDFLKIDCESTDRHVLKGAEQTIAKYRPTVQIEAPTVQTDELLESHNYRKVVVAEQHFTDAVYLPT